MYLSADTTKHVKYNEELIQDGILRPTARLQISRRKPRLEDNNTGKFQIF